MNKIYQPLTLRRALLQCYVWNASSNAQSNPIAEHSFHPSLADGERTQRTGKQCVQGGTDNKLHNLDLIPYSLDPEHTALEHSIKESGLHVEMGGDQEGILPTA